MEYVLALLVFDSERLPVVVEANVFGLLGRIMPLVIVVVTAAFLFGTRPRGAEMAKLLAAFQRPRRTWPWLAAHLLAYAVALGVTIFVFNAGRGAGQPWLWIGAWGGSAVCSLALWVVAVVPAAAFRPLAKPLARALAPGVLVGLLALLAGSATSVLWLPMSRATLKVVVSFLHAVGQPVLSVPRDLIVATPSFRVFIDRQCSGYEGIGLITVMMSFYLYFSRGSLRFPNALALLPLGALLVWLANAFRIAALILVGTWLSPAVAAGGFHSAAGWLLFCLITLGLVAVSERFSWFSFDAAKHRSGLDTPAAAFLLPLVLLLATGLVTKLFQAGFDYLYPLRVLAPLVPLWWLRSHYAGLRWSWSWTPIVLGGLAFVLWVGLEPATDPEARSPVQVGLETMSRAGAAVWLIARVLGSVVIVPLVEELAFRGYLLRRLIDADFTSVSPKQFTVTSFLVSSVAFGALHDRWVAGMLAGVLYALAQYKRGQVSDAIVAHATTNGALAAYVLAGGRWAFW